MVTNSEVVVIVQKIGHGKWLAIDPDGNDYVNDIPVHALRKVADTDQVLHRITTKTGRIQWRAKDFENFRYLFESASQLDDSMNMSNEKHADIVEFIANSPSMIPNSLVISETKWKYLVRSIVRGRNILMTGPSGCGKTLVAQTLSQIFQDRPYFYFNLGSTQDARSTLIGNTHFSKEDGTFVSKALFVEAISTPNAIILLDEFSRAHHDAVNILMTVLDQNQKYLRIDEAPDTPTIQVADGVTFVATANIGAEYTATRVLDRAILDRFQIIEMDTLNVDQEVGLLNLKFPEVADGSISAIAEIADHTRSVVKSDDPKVSTIISTRQTVELTSMIYDGFSLEESAEVCIYPFYSDAGGVDSERTYMKQLIQKYVSTNTDETPWSSTSMDEELIDFSQNA
jgi:nitric oxide reductase NorQ protein